ncbi:hypothetical protein NL676_034395 [Syzygium grande]|nr:hypothetical protein NL676_034395 [Syzygium grande]
MPCVKQSEIVKIRAAPNPARAPNLRFSFLVVGKSNPPTRKPPRFNAIWRLSSTPRASDFRLRYLQRAISRFRGQKIQLLLEVMLYRNQLRTVERT